MPDKVSQFYMNRYGLRTLGRRRMWVVRGRMPLLAPEPEGQMLVWESGCWVREKSLVL
jgi:hypothetical protein